VPTHQQIDPRSLLLHQRVAARVRANPALLDQARATLGRWRERASPRTFSDLDEWQHALDAGLDACLALATDESQHARALRQASPWPAC
jgi:hypothetical protein